MCEYCESEHVVKGTFYGADIKIYKCANETDLRKCQIVKYLGDSQYSVVIDDGLFAKGYLNINYCPMCGRYLRGKSENE